MSPARVWCYQEQFGEYPDYRIAKAVLAHHIWSCRHGAMPWARPIRWHRGTRPDGVVFTATAAHGEWLNHRIEQP
jgi:hypothetical protein